ncbi:hypothetical protein [Nonomuraea sp. NPDC049400]|uniref:hypothetical protein n=1 Tax=Nonomuraea sp. NPDC049400 TaxID=3364352 RepID=UPI0037A2681F
MLLAEIPLPPTGGRYAWVSVAGDLGSPLAGVHDLRITLLGDVRLATFLFT